jgi:hypothetical protein
MDSRIYSENSQRNLLRCEVIEHFAGTNERRESLNNLDCRRVLEFAIGTKSSVANRDLDWFCWRVPHREVGIGYVRLDTQNEPEAIAVEANTLTMKVPA